MDLYIYYRVRSENTAALHARIKSMQECLALEYAIVTGLKRRPEEKDGEQTWMEIYHAIPAGFETALESATICQELHALINGQRNTEYFLDVSSCA